MIHAELDIHPQADTTFSSEATVVPTSTVFSTEERPPLFVPRDEILFWTRTWQQGEAESAAAREAGDLRRFNAAEDLLSWLQSPDD